jgi:hypothetical protein
VIAGIRRLAARADRYHDWEIAMFRATGALARTEPEPARAALLGAHCAGHAERAEAWRRRRPSVEADVRAGDEIPAGIEGASFALLYGGLVPALRREYEDHLAAIDERLDGPTARLLTRCVAEVIAAESEAAQLAR